MKKLDNEDPLKIFLEEFLMPLEISTYKLCKGCKWRKLILKLNLFQVTFQQPPFVAVI